MQTVIDVVVLAWRGDGSSAISRLAPSGGAVRPHKFSVSREKEPVCRWHLFEKSSRHDGWLYRCAPAAVDEPQVCQPTLRHLLPAALLPSLIGCVCYSAVGARRPAAWGTAVALCHSVWLLFSTCCTSLEQGEGKLFLLCLYILQPLFILCDYHVKLDPPNFRFLVLFDTLFDSFQMRLGT